MSHFPPLYLTISRTVNAPRRLEALRARAANKSLPDWRAARKDTFLTDNAELSQGFNTKYAGSQYEKRMPVWVTFGASPFRNEQFVDELDSVNIDHRGWFTDADCSRTLRGLVAYLAGGRFLAGYVNSDTGEKVYFCKVFDCEKEAAWFADAEAKQLAEEEQEHDQRYQDAQDLDHEISEVSRNVARMFKLRHTDGFDSAADYRELEDGISELRKLKDKRAEYSDIEL